MPRTDLHPVRLLTIAIVALTALAAAPAAAQDTTPPVIEEPGHIIAQAARCTDATCTTFSGYLDDVVITAIDPVTGEAYSSCATSNPQQGIDHQCILDVPANSDVELTWSEDQVPDGYVSYGDPFPVGDAPVVTTLGFYPAVQEAPAPPGGTVSTLPSTGTGTAAGEPASGMPLLIAGLLVAGAGLTTDRRAMLAPARQRVRAR